MVFLSPAHEHLTEANVLGKSQSGKHINPAMSTREQITRRGNKSSEIPEGRVSLERGMLIQSLPPFHTCPPCPSLSLFPCPLSQAPFLAY